VARPPDPRAHQALLEAARLEFARSGLDRARVEDIARRAGISKGAFYLHFDSKEDAFQEILQRFLGVLEEHAHRRKEAEERFERGAEADWDASRAVEFECAADAELLQLMWRNRHILAALDSAAGTGVAQLLADFRRRMRTLIAGRITDKQSAGRLRKDVHPDVVADMVVGAYEDFGRRMMEMKEKPDLAAWARSLLIVLYDGILERPAQREPEPHPSTSKRPDDQDTGRR
jgi:AcrR family transcriptional regulator